MTWDGVVTNFYKKYANNIGLTDTVEAYLQPIVLKKSLESITFGNRLNSDDK